MGSDFSAAGVFDREVNNIDAAAIRQAVRVSSVKVGAVARFEHDRVGADLELELALDHVYEHFRTVAESVRNAPCGPNPDQDREHRVFLTMSEQEDALAAYLTKDFSASKWTDQEVGAAVIRGVLVLPLKVDIDPYGFIGRFQAMKAAADPHMLANRIASQLRVHLLTRNAIAEAVVDRFVKSYTYDDARANLERLQQLPTDVWTQDLADSVRQAVADNAQLADAYFGDKTVPSVALDLVSSLPSAATP